jgi:hypothetical protein
MVIGHDDVQQARKQKPYLATLEEAPSAEEGV